MEEEDGEKELTELQREIESQLDKDTTKRKRMNVGLPPISTVTIGE